MWNSLNVWIPMAIGIVIATLYSFKLWRSVAEEKKRREEKLVDLNQRILLDEQDELGEKVFHDTPNAGIKH